MAGVRIGRYVSAMFLPYKDENPAELPPIATVGIILLNTLAWLLVQGAGAAEPLARSVCQLGLIPGEILRSVPAGTAGPLGKGLSCVLTLVFLGIFVTTVAWPAYVILGYWFVLQLLLGAAGTLGGTQGGTAFWAHVGGFIAGLVLIKVFANPAFLERRSAGMLILPRD